MGLSLLTPRQFERCDAKVFVNKVLLPANALSAPNLAQARLRAKFGHVDAWIFDLDNTLYPSDSDLWPQIDQRITLFLMDRFGLDGLSARALHKYYYERYGTTLRGLIDEDFGRPRRFSGLRARYRPLVASCPILRLAEEIAALPGRKLIFTNGSRDHALRTVAQLGLAEVFEDAFDIVAANMTPKPAPAAYDSFFAKFGLDPKRSAMFEDIAKNLARSHRARHDDDIGHRPGRPGRLSRSARPHDRRCAVDRFRDERSCGISG